MSKKSRERRKARLEAEATGQPAPASPATLAKLKRRRNRRFLFVGLIGLSFPILEFIAYQFRTITISMINRTDMPLTTIKVKYDGGDFETDLIKPNGVFTRVVRPDFSFTKDHFSTYSMGIRFAAANGEIILQRGRAGALDFSASETYTVVQVPPDGRLQIQHTNRPGFPISLFRDLMEQLGIR